MLSNMESVEQMENNEQWTVCTGLPVIYVPYMVNQSTYDICTIYGQLAYL